MILLLATALAVELPVQGTLTADNGVVPHGTRAVTFEIHGTLPGGGLGPRWTDTATVSFVDGAFSLFIGGDSANPIPAALLTEEPLYLSVTVDGSTSTLAPIGWAPRAHFAGEAAHAAAADVADTLSGPLAAALLPSGLAWTTGDVGFNGAVSATSFSGSAAGLTAIPAGQITGSMITLTGTPSAAGHVVTKSHLDTALASYLPTSGGTLTGNLSVQGTVTATSFSGSGASLTGLDAAAITAGTLPDARLASTVARTTGASFTGAVNVTSTATPQVAVNPTSGHAYMSVNRPTSGAGEAGFMWRSANTLQWEAYLAPNDESNLRFWSGGNDQLRINNNGDLWVRGRVNAAGGYAMGGREQKSFFVPGANSKWYPVWFADDCWSNGSTRVTIARPDVHEDHPAQGNWYGSAIIHIDSHSTAWGHGSDYWEVFYRSTIPSRAPNPTPSEILGDFAMTYKATGFVIWLRGATTYRYTSPNCTTTPTLNSAATIENPLVTYPDPNGTHGVESWAPITAPDTSTSDDAFNVRQGWVRSHP